MTDAGGHGGGERRAAVSLAVVMPGHPQRDAGARVKLGALVDELATRVDRLEVVDNSLRGPGRLWCLARSFRPDRQRWRAEYRKSPAGFRARSRQVRRDLRALQPPVDAVLQVGVTCDATGVVPTVVYTDYFSPLSHAQPTLGRASRSARARRAWERLEAAALAAADALSVRSRFVADAMHAHGVSGDIAVVGGGVNPLPDVPRTPSDGGTRFLSIGDDFERKGMPTLLAAFAQVRRSHPTATLRLVTVLPSGTAVPEGVTVEAPSWNRGVVAGWYADADAFVLASRIETWGDVLIEAYHFSLPCIGVAESPMADIVRDGESGLLVPVDDADALAAAMLRLADRPDEAAAMGSAGRADVLARLTWPQVADRLVALLPTR